jgi:hypothetical protein
VTVLLAALRAEVTALAGHLDGTGLDALTEPGAVAARSAALPVPAEVITLRHSPKRRWSGRAVAAGAVVGLVMSGSGVAAALSASPGDLLYGVRRAVVGPVDDPWHQDAERLLGRAGSLVGTSTPAPQNRAQVTMMLASAAQLVPGIRDPGRRRQAAHQIAEWRTRLGLPPSPFPTAAPPAVLLAQLPLVTATTEPTTAESSSPAATPTPTDSAAALLAPTVPPSGGDVSGSVAVSGSPSDSASASAGSPSVTHSGSPTPRPSASRSRRPGHRASGTPTARSSDKASPKPSATHPATPSTGQQPRASSELTPSVEEYVSPTDSGSPAPSLETPSD